MALCAAALLVLAGCGQFNDDPAQGLTVKYQFADSGYAGASAGGSEPMLQGPTQGAPVFTVVIGAIVIRHARGGTCPAGQICPYTNSDQVTDTNRELLEEDAKQSVQFLELKQVDGVPGSNVVEFSYPQSTAQGPQWQLIAVGLRFPRFSLEEIQDIDPIWYGFSSQFLNGLVSEGQVLPTLTLNPWCAPDNPNPPGSPPCP